MSSNALNALNALNKVIEIKNSRLGVFYFWAQHLSQLDTQGANILKG
ncbi:hypothetical protein VIMY103929_00700 [Vibrio mytili]